jgi:hypothetical protein
MEFALNTAFVLYGLVGATFVGRGAYLALIEERDDPILILGYCIFGAFIVLHSLQYFGAFK